VFSPVAYTGTNVDNRLVDTGIVTDMVMARIRASTSTGGFYTADRLRGNASLGTAITDAENTDADSFMTPTVGVGNSFSAMNGFGVGNDATRQLNQSSTAQLAYAFQRRPGFFDVVCYTGNGVTRNINHNLGVVPEFYIIKQRSGGTSATGWATGGTVYPNATDYYTPFLNSNQASIQVANAWNTPTTTTFGIGTAFPNDDTWNKSNALYVAYLFATLAGVSKVGSYTGNGSSQTINCGFSGGARFVLIKRTDSTGDWYVWDTARGIVSGNDPRLSLNTTAAEVTSDDSVDPDSSGFVVNQLSATNINVSSASYIFLAIA
jgi:hypothetical protein